MKAVGYIRVSTNREEQADSLENQKALFLNEIKERGFDFQDFYVDIESGTTGNRKSLRKMLEDAEKGLFNVIIAKELSRFARNVELAHKIKRIASRNDIDLITLDGAIDTTKEDDDRIKFSLFAAIYEAESYRMSKRVKDVYKTKYQQGKFLGSVPPYGYYVKEQKLYIRNDKTPEIVKEIYNKFLSGWGFDKIARHLTSQHYPTPAEIAGKKNAGLYWQNSTIRKILSNYHYTGDLVQHRETTVDLGEKKRKKLSESEMIIVEDTHEAIISKQDFKRVQELIENRKQKGVGRQKPQKHLFTNILYCNECGKSLWYLNNIKGYVCGNYYKHGKIACSQHKVVEAELENIILNDVKTFAKKVNSHDILKKIQNKAKQQQQKIENKIKRLNHDMQVYKQRKSKLLDYFIDEKISKPDYDQKIQEYDAKIQALGKELFDITNSNNSNDIDTIDFLKKELNEILQFSNLTKNLLNRLVNKIVVSENGEVVIHYNFSTHSLM